MALSAILGIVSCLIAGVFALFSSWKDWKKDTKVVRSIKISLSVALIIISGLIIISSESEKTENDSKTATVGILRPERTTLISSDGSVFSKIKLKWGPNSGLWQVGKVNLGNALSIEQENGKIKLSAKIRNDKGIQIAELTDNEWSLNPNQIYDRNFNDKSLEIIDLNGNVILQVLYENDIIQLQCVLYDENGGGIAFWCDNTGAKSVMGNIASSLPIPIERMFLYPSKLHLGKEIQK